MLVKVISKLGLEEAMVDRLNKKSCPVNVSTLVAALGTAREEVGDRRLLEVDRTRNFSVVVRVPGSFLHRGRAGSRGVRNRGPDPQGKLLPRFHAIAF